MQRLGTEVNLELCEAKRDRLNLDLAYVWCMQMYVTVKPRLEYGKPRYTGRIRDAEWVEQRTSEIHIMHPVGPGLQIFMLDGISSVFTRILVYSFFLLHNTRC